MPGKKTPVAPAKRPVRTPDPKGLILDAWHRWKRGDRTRLLDLLLIFRTRPLPPLLYRIVLTLVTQAALPVNPLPKRRPGRPPVVSRLHNEAERAEIVKTVDWLRTIRPRMPYCRADELAADFHGTRAGQVKTYRLARPR